MKRLVLIDSNALVHRAFHALPPLSSPTGEPTNAIYGFTSVLLKMISDLKPDYMVATFDMAAPTFRHEEYDQYKAHRVKAPDELYAQIPSVKRMLGAFGVPILELEGFEADDVIGTISAQTQNIPDLQTVIVTGDLDTLQLVHGRKVVVFTMRKGMTDTIIYDEDGVRERYGISPIHVPDLKGLKGDASDNIPGVKGVGEKTATSLIQSYETLEHLYEEIEKPQFVVGKKSGVSEKLRATLIEQKDMALFSKKLATIIRDAPVTFDIAAAEWRQHLDTTQLQTLCSEFGFFSLLKRITSVVGAVVEAASTQSLNLDGDAPSEAIDAQDVPRITTDELPNAERVALHASASEGAITTLWMTTDGTTTLALDRPTPEDLARVFQKYQTVIGHDLKPVLKMLPNPAAVFGHAFLDTRIAAWLINPEFRDYSLERIAYEHASITLNPDQSTWPAIIWNLHATLWERMKSLDVERVYSDLEMPLIQILADMERTGIQVDTAHIDSLMEAASKDLAKLEEDIYKLAGVTFNINSPAQLGDILFNALGLQGKVRRTGGGAPSTAASELEKLRDEHPIIELIMQYRELNKLKTTYIEPFPSLVGADGRIHTTYNQTGTATGRLSSSDPNLQNIPTRTELGQRFRSTFIAPLGFQLLSLDYSQLELRLVAHMAHDETMIEAFKSGEDIHTRTASEILGLAPAQITKDMRRQAKVLNFGIIYGMGVMGFARTAGVDRTTAKKFIDEYFARFPGVARYMERTKEEAFQHGFVSTLLGRRRPLIDIKSSIPQLVAQAERMAINHPLQGTGADLVKLAMIAVARYIHDQYPDRSAVRMLLQVHDELVFEVEESVAHKLAHQFARIMESVITLEVPLIVDAKSGPNWADMKPIEHTDEV